MTKGTLRRTRRLLLAMLLCMPITLVAGDDIGDMLDVAKDGNHYLAFCVTHIDKAQQVGAINPIICSHWMSGVVAGFYAYESASHETLFDAPSGITVGQIEKIAVKYMNDHPQKLHEPTSLIVLWSLMDAYPPHR